MRRKAIGSTRLARLAPLALVVGLSGSAIAAETMDAIGVQDGRLTGDVDGKRLDAGAVIGTDFDEGGMVYSIIDAANDPFLPGLWRYRVAWRAQSDREWTPMCRNSRGSTGWAYVSMDDGAPRFTCEDAETARCLGRTSGLTAKKALSTCLGR